MIPTNYSPLYPSFHNIVRHLCKALWGEGTMDFAHFCSARYYVVNPERAILQSSHQESNSFDRPVHVTRDSINHATCDEDLEQFSSRVPEPVLVLPHKASIANPNENESIRWRFGNVPVHCTRP